MGIKTLFLFCCVSPLWTGGQRAHSGRFVSFLLKYGETGARPDNGDDLQSAGPQGCLLFGINQRVLHHWVRGLPAQDSTVGTLTYQLQGQGLCW